MDSRIPGDVRPDNGHRAWRAAYARGSAATADRWGSCQGRPDPTPHPSGLTICQYRAEPRPAAFTSPGQK